MISPLLAAPGAQLAPGPGPEPPLTHGAAAGLLIGYLRPAHGCEPAAEAAALRQAGCATIRTESSAQGATLLALLAFMAAGDRLVLPSVAHLPGRFGGLERLLRELDARGAEAVLLAEGLCTAGEEGRLLRRAVSAAAALQPGPRRPRARPTAAVRARARSMAAGGAAPGEIAAPCRSRG
jgi:hypothetical protein